METPLGSSRRLVLLDGGLGTALEDSIGTKIVNKSSLWSAQPIAENPTAISRVHKGFLDSNAQVISTSTYQCSLSTFKQSGYNEADARRLMRRAVAIAQQAVHRHHSEHRCGSTKRAAIALSLGPFGATLRPTQDFGGFYPAPYGPQEFVKNGVNTNIFRTDADEQRAIHALTEFHFSRLSIFAQHKETWDAIDCIAFETIPLQREVTAIRYAIARLLEEKTIGSKRWWISCVFPQGVSPDQGLAVNGSKSRVRGLLSAAFKDDRGESLPIPNGFGINCTAIKHVPDLATDVLEYFQANFRDENEAPWLVLYPNGSHTFDETTGQWAKTAGRLTWAQELSQIVHCILKGHAPRKLLVGGCCKVSRDDIRELGELLNTSDSHCRL